jgi:hypothetical protein
LPFAICCMCVLFLVGVGLSPLLAAYAWCSAPRVGSRASVVERVDTEDQRHEQGITVGRPLGPRPHTQLAQRELQEHQILQSLQQDLQLLQEELKPEPEPEPEPETEPEELQVEPGPVGPAEP